MTVKPRKMAVYPPRPLPKTPCVHCSGFGTTDGDGRYEADLGDYILALSTICDPCQGCGSADHAECDPRDHVHPGEFIGDGTAQDRDAFGPMEIAECGKCYGRKWQHTIAGGEDEEGAVIITLKVPCECADDLLRIIE